MTDDDARAIRSDLADIKTRMRRVEMWIASLTGAIALAGFYLQYVS